jgi:branched-chain amino acid transport system permease protein
MSNIQLLLDAPILLVQLIADGVLVGAIFALAAYGMALVWGVMNVINVAQGEFVMIGGYVAFVLYSLGIHPLLGVPAAAIAAIVLFVLGWAIYRLVIFRVVDRDLFISLLATFGLSILIQQLLNQIFTSDVQSADSGLDTLFLFEGLVVVPHIKVVAFALTLAIAGCLVVFLKSARRSAPRHRTPGPRASSGSTPTGSMPRPMA